MKVKVLFTGKTTEAWIRQGIEVYAGRIRHYVSFELVEIPDLRQTASLTEETMPSLTVVVPGAPLAEYLGRTCRSNVRLPSTKDTTLTPPTVPEEQLADMPNPASVLSNQ